MKYKCVVVDDEELARELIETHLSQLNEFELVASCASAIEASKVLASESVDLLFLDIEMPVLKGTDFLKSLSKVPKVIFTTAYRDYALEGFELNALDYLLKPIVFERFFKAIQKFLESEQSQVSERVDEVKATKQDFVFVQANRKMVKVQFHDILYVESLKDYIKITTKHEAVMTKHGLTAFHELLDNRFIRVHRSYIVNKEAITAFTKHDIEINKIEIPIGENYKEKVLENLKTQ